MAESRLVSALRISPARIIGLALAAIGIILLLMAWTAQSDIDNIGTTNDPLLQHRISVLEDRRDVSLVAGIGFVFMGMFAIALLSEPSSPSIVSESGMISSARLAGETLSGLSLAGNSSYLPARHGLTKERVFIAATKGSAIPPSSLTDDLTMSPGKDGSTPGMLAEPLGLSLLNSIERELDTKVDGAGLEAAEGALQILKHGLGMIRDFHFKEREGKFILRVEYSGLLDACRTVRKERGDTCRQLECIGCSCLLVAAARATGKLISVEEVDNSTDTVVFTLNLKEW